MILSDPPLTGHLSGWGKSASAEPCGSSLPGAQSTCTLTTLYLVSVYHLSNSEYGTLVPFTTVCLHADTTGHRIRLVADIQALKIFILEHCVFIFISHAKFLFDLFNGNASFLYAYLSFSYLMIWCWCKITNSVHITKIT